MTRIRCLAAALAGLAGALLAFAAAAPAALAGRVPIPPGPAGITSPTGPWIGQPPGHVVVPLYRVHTVVVGGMPGWQITAIAAGAALLAAVLAVILDRSRAARQPKIAPSA
jgi:hypothetical protein